MKTQFDVRAEARAVFDKEIEALRKTRDGLGKDFENLVELVLNCRGKVILSGMSSEEQVADNLATFCDPKPLTDEEMQTIKEVRSRIEACTFVGCTNCKYCMPCPFGVDIPQNFAMMNEFAKYGNVGHRKFQWNNMEEGERADKCKSCGKCETACPQGIPIREKLHEIAAQMKA
jgi:predicted aldo/keto reductase-like oxidoreductase